MKILPEKGSQQVEVQELESHEIAVLLDRVGTLLDDNRNLVTGTTHQVLAI